MSCGIPATIRALSGNSRRKARQPAEAAAPIAPDEEAGATLLERPRRSDQGAAAAGASTTTVASARPLMILLRRGKVPWLGVISGASSDTAAPPPATIETASRWWARGWMSARPEPIAATVVAPACNAAACRGPVDADRRPDTTLAPVATRSPAIRAAIARPRIGRAARADDRDGSGEAERGRVAEDVQHVRRHVDRRQSQRIRRVLDRHDASPSSRIRPIV